MLKCFLVSNQIEPPKTHDMQVLIEMCADVNSDFDMIYEESITLTNYAVRLRYPAELGLIEHDAESAVEIASKVMLFVKDILADSGLQCDGE